MSILYANGNAPENQLVVVDGIHCSPDVAYRMNLLISWAAKRGRSVRIAHKYGGYRNRAEQAAVEPGSTGNSASNVQVAEVGRSSHGWWAAADALDGATSGRVDLVGSNGVSYTAAELAWFVEVAPLFGLTREFPGPAPKLYDPNHFKVTGPVDPSILAEMAAPPELIGDDMNGAIVVHINGGPVTGAFYVWSREFCANVTESTGKWLASLYNVDKLSDRGSGRVIELQDAPNASAQWEAWNVYGISPAVLEATYVSQTAKVWTPSIAAPASSTAPGVPVDTTGLATKADIAEYATSTSSDIAAVGKKVDAIKIPTTYVAQ